MCVCSLAQVWQSAWDNRSLLSIRPLDIKSAVMLTDGSTSTQTRMTVLSLCRILGFSANSDARHVRCDVIITWTLYLEVVFRYTSRFVKNPLPWKTYRRVSTTTCSVVVCTSTTCLLDQAVWITAHRWMKSMPLHWWLLTYLVHTSTDSEHLQGGKREL